MELRHLRSFIAVADSAHFGRAAEGLGIGQSVLSRQVQQLERELGVSLLERFPRVRLTPAGQAFLSEARQAVAQLEEAGRRATRVGLGETTSLVVAHVELVAYDGFLPVACAMLRRLHPSVDVELQLSRSIDACRLILERRVDVGFVYAPPARADLVTEVVSGSRYAAVVPRAHPLAARTSVRARELGGEPLVGFSRGLNPAFYDEFVRRCREAGLDPQFAHRTPHVAAALGLVAAGAGSTIAPLAYRSAAPADVAFVALEDFPLVVHVHCVWRADNDSPALARFLEVVRATARDRGSPSAAIPAG
jgi:DNA-binding transcriptional LysR family regulator